jgi:acetyl esterase/lipase
MQIKRWLPWLPLVASLTVATVSGCSGQQFLNDITPSGVVQRNLPFGGFQQTLDVYRPNSTSPAPVVVFFYGGRWTDGDKKDYHFVGQALAAQGFVAVLPDYRKYPAVKHPAWVVDASEAVNYARDHAKDWGGDPNKIFVMGHSAGAHLAAMLAVAPEFKAGTLAGVISLAGPLDFLPLKEADLQDMFGPPERYPLSQPIHLAQQSRTPFAPMLLLHGQDDTSVWSKNSKNLAAVLEAKGSPVQLHVYPKMSHSWIVASLATRLQFQNDVMERVAGFVRGQ